MNNEQKMTAERLKRIESVLSNFTNDQLKTLAESIPDAEGPTMKEYAAQFAVGGTVTVLMDIYSQTVDCVYRDEGEAIEACREDHRLVPFTFPLIPKGEVEQKEESRSETLSRLWPEYFSPDPTNQPSPDQEQPE